MSLIRLRTLCDGFSEKDVIPFVECLLKKSDHGVNSVISGIFRQLYFEGDTNEQRLLHALQHQANKLIKNKEQSRIDVNNDTQCCITDIPDNLLSEIVTHLPAKEILLNWNHVNRKFIQIGYKPESLREINWGDFAHPYQIHKYPPKFKINDCLSSLKSMNYFFDVSHIFTPFVMRSLRKVTITGCAGIKFEENCNFTVDRMDNIQELCLNRIEWNTNDAIWQKFYGRYLSDNNVSNNLKRISFDHVRMGFRYRRRTVDGGIYDNLEHKCRVERGIDSVLQAIIPLSLQNVELKERLNREITDEMKNEKQEWEIEKIENKIKNEVELKYNTFDENEFNDVENDDELELEMNERCRVDRWHSNLEMISIYEYDSIVMGSNDIPKQKYNWFIHKCHKKESEIVYTI